MSLKDILLHLRFPFSLFLMPMYWLAVSQQQAADTAKNIWIFIVLHILVYPASNAFNSYFDKDEGSIGGLENPPKVDIKLWYTANFFDIMGIMVAYVFVNFWFSLFVFFYILVSRMYSHPIIRIKQYPILSWLVIGVFQGALVFFMVYTFGQNLETSDFFNSLNLNRAPLWLGCLFSALILWAVYPITQVYQHEEDAKNGDFTLSRKLGIRGTFIFTMIVFSFAVINAYFFLEISHFFRFILFSIPIAIFLNWWFLKVWKDESQANFKYTMLLNLMASLLLNICFALNIFF